ncbi:MAG: P-II family nitrogen regulator [Christensenellales bacterium]|nr:P-II family nitrogen regulator [Christensenellales bacterium]
MSELYLMFTIANRHYLQKYLGVYREQNIGVVLITLGRGTAVNEILDTFGLEGSEKFIMCCVVTGENWKKCKRELQDRLKIDVPGRGIAFIVPLSAIYGKRQLMFLTKGQNFVQGEETVLKDTTHEMLIVIANYGYTDEIMAAARGAGANGGTVIHARGTDMNGAEKFLGFSLTTEKEMVCIVTKRESRDAIMGAIMDRAGVKSKAKSIVISLPVTSTAGMRLMEREEESD